MLVNVRLLEREMRVEWTWPSGLRRVACVDGGSVEGFNRSGGVAGMEMMSSLLLAAREKGRRQRSNMLCPIGLRCMAVYAMYSEVGTGDLMP